MLRCFLLTFTLEEKKKGTWLLGKGPPRDFFSWSGISLEPAELGEWGAGVALVESEGTRSLGECKAGQI